MEFNTPLLISTVLSSLFVWRIARSQVPGAAELEKRGWDDFSDRLLS